MGSYNAIKKIESPRLAFKGFVIFKQMHTQIEALALHVIGSTQCVKNLDCFLCNI